VPKHGLFGRLNGIRRGNHHPVGSGPFAELRPADALMCILPDGPYDYGNPARCYRDGDLHAFYIFFFSKRIELAHTAEHHQTTNA